MKTSRTHNEQRPGLFSRQMFTLFLILSLALPVPALALRPMTGQEGAGLEEMEKSLKAVRRPTARTQILAFLQLYFVENPGGGRLTVSEIKRLGERKGFYFSEASVRDNLSPVQEEFNKANVGREEGRKFSLVPPRKLNRVRVSNRDVEGSIRRYLESLRSRRTVTLTVVQLVRGAKLVKQTLYLNGQFRHLAFIEKENQWRKQHGLDPIRIRTSHYPKLLRQRLKVINAERAVPLMTLERKTPGGYGLSMGVAEGERRLIVDLSRWSLKLLEKDGSTLGVLQPSRGFKQSEEGRVEFLDLLELIGLAGGVQSVRILQENKEINERESIAGTAELALADNGGLLSFQIRPNLWKMEWKASPGAAGLEEDEEFLGQVRKWAEKAQTLPGEGVVNIQKDSGQSFRLAVRVPSTGQQVVLDLRSGLVLLYQAPVPNREPEIEGFLSAGPEFKWTEASKEDLLSILDRIARSGGIAEVGINPGLIADHYTEPETVTGIVNLKLQDRSQVQIRVREGPWNLQWQEPLVQQEVGPRTIPLLPEEQISYGELLHHLDPALLLYDRSHPYKFFEEGGIQILRTEEGGNHEFGFRVILPKDQWRGNELVSMTGEALHPGRESQVLLTRYEGMPPSEVLFYLDVDDRLHLSMEGVPEGELSHALSLLIQGIAKLMPPKVQVLQQGGETVAELRDMIRLNLDSGKVPADPVAYRGRFQAIWPLLSHPDGSSLDLLLEMLNPTSDLWETAYTIRQAIVKGLADRHESVQKFTEEQRTQVIRPALSSLLISSARNGQDPNEDVRWTAVQALVRLTPRGKEDETIPILEMVRDHDSSQFVQGVASEGIRRLTLQQEPGAPVSPMRVLSGPSADFPLAQPLQTTDTQAPVRPSEVGADRNRTLFGLLWSLWNRSVEMEIPFEKYLAEYLEQEPLKSIRLIDDVWMQNGDFKRIELDRSSLDNGAGIFTAFLPEGHWDSGRLDKFLQEVGADGQVPRGGQLSPEIRVKRADGSEEIFQIVAIPDHGLLIQAKRGSSRDFLKILPGLLDVAIRVSGRGTVSVQRAARSTQELLQLLSEADLRARREAIQEIAVRYVQGSVSEEDRLRVLSSVWVLLTRPGYQDSEGRDPEAGVRLVALQALGLLTRSVERELAQGMVVVEHVSEHDQSEPVKDAADKLFNVFQELRAQVPLDFHWLSGDQEEVRRTFGIERGQEVLFIPTDAVDEIPELTGVFLHADLYALAAALPKMQIIPLMVPGQGREREAKDRSRGMLQGARPNDLVIFNSRHVRLESVKEWLPQGWSPEDLKTPVLIVGEELAGRLLPIPMRKEFEQVVMRRLALLRAVAAQLRRPLMASRVEFDVEFEGQKGLAFYL